MRTIAGLISVIILCSLTHAAKFTDPLLILDNRDKYPIRTDFTNYGAYIEVDELFIEISSSFFKQPRNKIIVNKKIRILTNEGVDYGSISIPMYGDRIESFMVNLLDSNGNSVPLNTAQIKEQYVKRGVVVFPNVTAGCQLEIKIVYLHKSIAQAFEYSFPTSIPIALGRFTMSIPPDHDYELKTYGELGKKEKSSVYKTGHVYHSWTLKDILPTSRITYLPPSAYYEPCIAVVLRSRYDKPQNLNWVTIGKNLSAIYDRIDQWEYHSLDKTVDSLLVSKKTPLEKVSALCGWVQDNISLSDNWVPADLDQLKKAGSADTYQMALLTYYLLKQAGLKPDIIFTRNIYAGGFDKTFAYPYACSVPLLTIIDRDKKHIVFPFDKVAGIDEYPSSFFGLHGLSISEKQPILLPAPLDSSSAFLYDIGLDLKNDTKVDTLKIKIEGYGAYDWRSRLVHLQEKDRKEFFQEIIRRRGASNALITYNLYGLEDKGKKIEAHITYTNDQQVISKGNMKRVSLSNILREYFSDYDTSRISPFCVFEPYSVIEKISIPNADSLTIDIEQHKLDNKLFTSACTTYIDFLGKATIERKVVIKKVTLSQSDMKTIYPDIQLLNKERQAAILVRGEG